MATMDRSRQKGCRRPKEERTMLPYDAMHAMSLKQQHREYGSTETEKPRKQSSRPRRSMADRLSRAYTAVLSLLA
jgi:hypothetical protein